MGGRWMSSHRQCKPCQCRRDKGANWERSKADLPHDELFSGQQEQVPTAKAKPPRKTIIFDSNLWESLAYVYKFEYHPFTLQIHKWQGMSNLQPSLSSSKRIHSLLLGWCNIWAQHPLLWKTWGWFTCCSLSKSYTSHYAMIISHEPLYQNLPYIFASCHSSPPLSLSLKGKMICWRRI